MVSILCIYNLMRRENIGRYDVKETYMNQEMVFMSVCCGLKK